MNFRNMIQVSLLLFCLFLATTRAQKPEWNDVMNCPQICKCTMKEKSETLPDRKTIWAKTVDCARKNLKVFDFRIPNDTEVLKLNGNLFNNFYDAIFSVSNFKNLTEIVLSGNEISKLFGNTTWEYVERLTINENKIENLTEKIFQSFPNSKELSLERNRLKFINFSTNISSNLRLLRLDSNQIADLNWLKNATVLSNLDMLVLGGNQLESKNINFEIFQGLKKLRVLIMDGMEIETIKNKVSTGLNLLETLDLDNNLLTELPSALFQSLESLKYLNLNQNQFKKLEPLSFSNLTNVEAIELTKLQHLTIIDEKAFSNLPNLQTLLLFKNSRLSFIAKQAFYNCPSLQTIDLHATMIESIYPQTFNLLPALKSVEFKGNPVNCNCLVDGIKQWIRTKNPGETNDDVVCASPPELRGGRVSDVITDDVTSCQPTVQPTFPYRITVNFNEEIELPCRAYGVPDPKIVWFLPDGNLISNTTNETALIGNNTKAQQRVMVDVFGTLKLKAQISGDYVCTAENNKGMASRKININVLQTTTSFIPTTANLHKQTTITSDKSEQESTTATIHTTRIPTPTEIAKTTTTKSTSTIRQTETTEIQTTTTTLSSTTKTTNNSPTTKAATTTKFETTIDTTTEQDQLSCLQAPIIEVIESKPTSTLITWNSQVTPLTWKLLANQYVMLISLEHNGRVISTEEVQAFSFTPDGEIESPEYKISLLNPGQVYKICLIVSCKRPMYANRSCVEINTTPNFDASSSRVAVNTSIGICVTILVVGLLIVLCYGKICHPYTWRSQKYEGLEDDDKPNYKHAIPLNNIYSPLLPVNQDWSEEPKLTDKLVDTSSSAVYGV